MNTHEELLAKIDDTVVRTPGQMPKDKLGQLMQNTKALRAVIELTKVRLEPISSGLEKYEGFELAMRLIAQAIEKELK